MSEQFYYTFSNIGSGPTNGERIRAQSPGVGSVNSEQVRALMKYLSYRLPAGVVQTPVDAAPIGLTLAKTPYDRILSHRKYVDREGIGRPGNFFTHVVINPEGISEQTKAVEPLSARAAISLWKSPFWKISESQAPPKSTAIESLTAQDIQQSTNTTWQGKLSELSLRLQHPHCTTQANDYFPLIFSAFLMLKKLNKTQLYIAAPAEMVATFIWCITRCLPRTLTIMQDLTFSTYEYEISKSTTTITGTCWLPPANHSGPFVPKSDLPTLFYQPLPTNAVLAINCYNQRQTSFEVDEQVSKFVQFATQSLRQNNLTQIDQLIAQAERREYQDFEELLVLFRIQQEEPTKAIIQNILTTPKLWSYLQYSNIQEKLIQLMYDTQDSDWLNWWKTQGEEEFLRMCRWTSKQPTSEEAIALNAFANKVVNELCVVLNTDQPTSNNWSMYWDTLLNNICNLSSDQTVWMPFPQRFLLQIPYRKTYEFWWQRSGKSIIEKLYQTAHTNPNLPEYQQLLTDLNHWGLQCAEHLRASWSQRYDTETSFWLDLLRTTNRPTKGSQLWLMLLDDLDTLLPAESHPSTWCPQAYLDLMLTWQHIVTEQHPLSAQWFKIAWQRLPPVIAQEDLSIEWRTIILAERIRPFQAPASDQLAVLAAKCAPLLHDVLAQLIQNDQDRTQTVDFCVFLLEKAYQHRDALLTAIVPPLLSYESEIQRIAKAANMSQEELNTFLEDTLYTVLTSQQDIPAWLFQPLENYLTYFRAQTLTPEYQKLNPEISQKKRAILDALVKSNNPSLERFRPHIACWHTLSQFFRQPLLYRDTLLSMRNEIKVVPLSETVRTELNQVMIAFLAEEVTTEIDLGRVIDYLGVTLMISEGGSRWANVLLLKEMARIVGERTKNHPLSKFVVYIKVLISETSDLDHLGLSPDQQKQFTSECLDSLLVNVSNASIKELKTQSHWPVHILNKWKEYQPKRTTAKPVQPPAQNSLPSGGSEWDNQNYQYTPTSSTSTPPATDDESSETRSTKPSTQQVSHTKDTSQLPAQRESNRGGLFNWGKSDKPNFEEALKAFNKAFESGRADKIAAAYSDAIDSRLTTEQRTVAIMSKQLIEAYNAYNKSQTTESFNKFAYAYNAIINSSHSYILSYPEMRETVRMIVKRQ